jgi:hypothetical protein
VILSIVSKIRKIEETKENLVKPKEETPFYAYENYELEVFHISTVMS